MPNIVDLVQPKFLASAWDATKEKQDAYGYIADKACEEMGIPVGSIPRSVAKKPVMLLPYGAAARTMIGHAISAVEEEIELLAIKMYEIEYF